MENTSSEFLTDVIEGFSAEQKWISPQYFYDAIGCEIYAEIKEVPEYYLPSRERDLVAEIADELGEVLSAVSQVIEYGGGSDVRTETLVQCLPNLSEYLPLDVAIEQLDSTAAIVNAVRPDVTVTPLLGVFSDLPAITNGKPENRLGFLPGSTIGNFNSGGAQQFLCAIRNQLGEGSQLLVGYDLVKDEDVLLAAYDDAAGVTRRFNLNLLHRMNRELDGNIDVSTFWHMVEYNRELDRIETYLESTLEQTVTIGGHNFDFEKGERIHTENSHKYSPSRFAEAIAGSGWTHVKTWNTKDDYYALTLLR